MENEELFAGEPEVDAQVRARERREVTETTRLLPESNAVSNQQPFYLTDTRPRWRRPSVSGDPKSLKINRLIHPCNRFGGCSHLESCSCWDSVDLPFQRSI